MRGTGRDFFACEYNLNLMTASELEHAATLNSDFEHKVSYVSLGGWPSNLLLTMCRSRLVAI